MKVIKTPTQILTTTCPVCGPRKVSWEWRCSGDTEIKCPSCGAGLGRKVKSVRDELREHGTAAVHKILHR